LAAIVNSSDDAIIGKSLDGRILSWNPAAQRIYGYSASEAVGRSISILVPPGQQDELDAILARLVAGESVAHFETVRRRKDGLDIDVSLTISPVRDHAGTLVGASTIGRDITERRRTDARIRAAEEQFRHSFDGAPIGMMITDLDGRYLDVNDAFCACDPGRALAPRDHASRRSGRR
jgi:PAS domain S-box-containing protein